MKLLFILFFLIPSLLKAQLPVKDGKVFYETIDTTSLNKEELYNVSKLWLANTFRDSKSVIEIDNKELGSIVGKGNFEIGASWMLTYTVLQCRFNIKIDIKDLKYRIQLYNFFLA